MLKNIFTTLRNCQCLNKSYSTSTALEPRKLLFPPKYLKSRQVWVENLDTIDEKKMGLLDLHPEVFADSPRIDVIHQNVRWQRMYGYVCYAHTKVRSEVRGGGRKPFPQKGMCNVKLLEGSSILYFFFNRVRTIKAWFNTQSFVERGRSDSRSTIANSSFLYVAILYTSNGFNIYLIN